MADGQSSPFSRLDTGLLRSTKALQPEPLPESGTQQQLSTPESPPSKRPAPRSKPARSRQDADLATKLASALANETTTDASDDVVQLIRRTVRTPGREVSFVRLTPEEKRRLTDLVYTHKRQGQRTSETEINRIAVNYILEDYARHGATSVLARVLEAMHEQ